MKKEGSSLTGGFRSSRSRLVKNMKVFHLFYEELVKTTFACLNTKVVKRILYCIDLKSCEAF